MNEVRTPGSWLIIWLSALALCALLWFSVAKQFDNGIKGAVSALFNPNIQRSIEVPTPSASVDEDTATRAPAFGMNITGTSTEVRAALPKGPLGQSVWDALQKRPDAEKLKVNIEEYDTPPNTDAGWANNLPDFINNLPVQTESSDLHLLITNEQTTLVGKVDNEEQKEQLIEALREAAPNSPVSAESFKVNQVELPFLSLEKNGSVLEVKGLLASEYQTDGFAENLKNITNASELVDSLRYSSQIEKPSPELDNIEDVVKLLGENGVRSTIEVKDEKYTMQLFGYEGDNAESLREEVAKALGDVPFELFIGSVNSQDLKAIPEKQVETPAANRGILAVNFGFNSYKLTPESEPALNELLERLWANSELSLVIEGHTDSTGSPVSNQLLSQQRAEAVKTYLIESGIDATRLKALGFGDEKPISSNETSEGRFKNRRIEVREEQNS